MGVTVLDVAEALAENIDVPAGQLDTGATVRVIDRPSDAPEQLRMRVIGQRDGSPIRIGDVATMQEVPVPPHAEPLELGIRFMRGTDRTRLASQIVRVIRADVPSGVSITTTPPVARAPRVTLIGDDQATLAHAADDVARALGIEVPHEPTVEMTIDRERATAFGISAAELGRAIAVALGQPVARTSDGTDVVLRAAELERLHVRGAQGALVNLTDLVTRRIRDGEVVRLRIDRRPAIELTVAGRSVADVRRRVGTVTLPNAIRVQVR
jgi:multidrug efflux pump subunit AcrB